MPSSNLRQALWGEGTHTHKHAGVCQERRVRARVMASKLTMITSGRSTRPATRTREICDAKTISQRRNSPLSSQLSLLQSESYFTMLLMMHVPSPTHHRFLTLQQQAMLHHQGSVFNMNFKYVTRFGAVIQNMWNETLTDFQHIIYPSTFLHL